MLCAEIDLAGNDFTVSEEGRGYTRFVSYYEIEALLESAGYSAEEIDYDWIGAEDPADAETAAAGGVFSWAF
jgi:hypothetical protein